MTSPLRLERKSDQSRMDPQENLKKPAPGYLCKIAQSVISNLASTFYFLGRCVYSLANRTIACVNCQMFSGEKNLSTAKKVDNAACASNIKNEIAPFTGDLTPLQKAVIRANFIDDYALNISFQHHPEIDFTIRRQDIFTSGAEVIVNAANTHLGGGGGIDGAIHKQGGSTYAKAHHELQTLYKAEYIEGHAALIDSGELKEKYNIENVIVVAGPQGDTSPSKETQLYSCYFNTLVLAHSQNKTSVAFPSISTGIFGFPKERAAAISLKAVQDFVDQYPDTQLKTISIHFLPNAPIEDLEIYQAQI